MNSFERQAFEPPAPSHMVILARHGSRFKVSLYRHTRILDLEQVKHYAAKHDGRVTDRVGIMRLVNGVTK